MNSFLLRMEGVNLSHFVYDTQDLSTIRGGGLQLLNAATAAGEFLKTRGSVEALIQSASIGLFRVESAKSPEAVRAEVEGLLASKFPHATFVVDVNETQEDSIDSRALLLAKNRWRQMQAPTVIYPSLEGVTKSTEVCEIDMVRPAARGERHSASVVSRKRFGKDRKQKFYIDEMERAGPVDPDLRNLTFTHDFDDLCGKSRNWGNLADKMAVVHLDGNQFGAIQAKHCGLERQVRNFSQGLRCAQAGFLTKLLKRADPDPEWRNSDYKRIRLETLLWGGDEIIWVVPAWKGWELLQFFFEECASNPRPEWNPAVYPLTYAAGLVFCHQKAPIHTITKLANDLVGQVKDVDENDRYKNRFVYQVLESFDHIGKVGERYKRLVLAGEMMPRIAEAMPQVRESVSRKKLHRILKAKPGPERTEIEASIKKELISAGAAKALALIEDLKDVAWEHLGELWDYVAPAGGEV